MFIEHKAEDDEAGNKPHCHVWILPAKPVDMSSFRNHFKEMDPGNDKPLGVLPFRRTVKFKDWLLYALHDELYLMSKLQSRRFHYSRKDIQCSDEDYLRLMCYEASFTDEKDALATKLRQAFSMGLGWPDILANGLLKAHEIYGGKEIFQAIVEQAKKGTDRNGRSGHEKSVSVGQDGELLLMEEVQSDDDF